MAARQRQSQGKTIRRRVVALVALSAVASLLVASSASAGDASLYRGPGPRPGPDLLYAKAATVPQLQNRGVWKASPILVSGASAYRRGEFLYQDFLYDDHGARLTTDPTDPRTAGNTFSKPNGTLTYPTGDEYANNAADLVELRVKPLRRSTAFRVTLNTMKDPSLVAFTIAIGGRAGNLQPFPFGAAVKAPARYFLTARPVAGKLRAVLTRTDGSRVRGARPKISVDTKRRQVSVFVSPGQWNPGRSTVRLAAGVGLWDADAGTYLHPGAVADATHPGGAGVTQNAPAFFNVAFRSGEPMQSVTESAAVLTDAAWWRDRAQGHALAAGDISDFFANVSFRKLRRLKRDDRGVPRTGPMDRILPSHFEIAQGADYGPSCFGAPADCPGQYQGRLQPYAIYVPPEKPPARGYGMTLQMHSLGASYNQYLGSRNQAQFGDRSTGSIVITPEARGPDENYENYGAADVFDVWNDVARRYPLDPSFTSITGYSMGGIGTYKLGSQFPDLFARAQPTVGFESNTAVLASLRNVPVLAWNTHGDELVNDVLFNATAAKLESLGYRYELDTYQPCAATGCSPLFPNHLELAVNDEYAPAADFLGAQRVERNPAHVTYVASPDRDHANLQIVGDHAYWASAVKPRASGAGQVDVISRGFGVSDPTPSATQLGLGTLTGGNLGNLTFDRRFKTWSDPTPGPIADALTVTATNVASFTIDPERAQVDCKANVSIVSDGPIDVTLAGCDRTVHSG